MSELENPELDSARVSMNMAFDLSMCYTPPSITLVRFSRYYADENGRI